VVQSCHQDPFFGFGLPKTARYKKIACFIGERQTVCENPPYDNREETRHGRDLRYLSDLLGGDPVNDSRPRVRKSAPRRSRKVQKTFTALLSPPDEETSEAAFPAIDFKTFPYRVALANWPDEWRERWGHRANALEDDGLSWREAESRAFFEIQEERRFVVGIQPIPLMSPTVDRN
jgi:hypothetical protein